MFINGNNNLDFKEHHHPDLKSLIKDHTHVAADSFQGDTEKRINTLRQIYDSGNLCPTMTESCTTVVALPIEIEDFERGKVIKFKQASSQKQ